MVLSRIRTPNRISRFPPNEETPMIEPATQNDSSAFSRGTINHGPLLNSYRSPIGSRNRRSCSPMGRSPRTGSGALRSHMTNQIRRVARNWQAGRKTGRFGDHSDAFDHVCERITFRPPQNNRLLEPLENARMDTIQGLAGCERQRLVVDIPGQIVRFENLLEELADRSFAFRRWWKLHTRLKGQTGLEKAGRIDFDDQADPAAQRGIRTVNDVRYLMTVPSESLPPH